MPAKVDISGYLDISTMQSNIATAANERRGAETLGSSGERALGALAALGQPTRLAIFRFLVTHEPCGMTVGDIADAMSCPQNTTSGHLAVLSRGGLVNSKRNGRSVVYRADMAGMRWLLEYLLADCCNGDPSLCAEAFTSLCDGTCKNETKAGA